MNDYLKKRGLNVGQARRMVYDRSEWQLFARERAWGIALGFGGLLWPSLQLKGIKGKLSFLFYYVLSLLSLS